MDNFPSWWTEDNLLLIQSLLCTPEAESNGLEFGPNSSRVHKMAEENAHKAANQGNLVEISHLFLKIQANLILYHINCLFSKTTLSQLPAS